MGDAINWCPVDPLAKYVLELGDSQGYFHAVCPRTTTWTKLLPALRGFYGGRVWKVVSFGEWVDLLKATAVDADAAKVAEVPGIKLIDTFQGFAGGSEDREPIRYATERSCEASATLAGLEAVTPDLLKIWAKQCAF
jgi:hypothetical protein